MDKHLDTVSASDLSRWDARLDLHFDRNAQGATRLKHQHLGPLRIQKALYPEGVGVCHAVIVHPPGGIASGDHLEIRTHVDQHCHGLVTTPSAAKWYGSDAAQQASQTVVANVEGALEWLPLETIVFDRAEVNSQLEFHLGSTASMIGWDHLIFGRKASGESFARGRFAQSLKLVTDEGVLWQDRLLLQGADPLFDSVIGLRGYHAFATLWAILPADQAWTEQTIDDLRVQEPRVAWTALHTRLLLGRVLIEPLAIKPVLEKAWMNLRPRVFNISAVPPRLWAT